MKQLVIDKLNKIELFNKDKKKINSLNLHINVLEEVIKNELYKDFMFNLDEKMENDRLKKDNKKLRFQIKSLKEIIKEGK